MLTPVQLATLKAHVLANTATVPAGQPWTGAFAGVQVKDVPNTPDGNAAIAGWYNQVASPAWTLWKTNVPIGTVGKAFVATALAAITAGNTDKLNNFASWNPDGVDPSRPDQRAFFDDVFGVAAGASTRAALAALWKRLATNAQKLFSTGTGSDAAPATPDAGTDDGFTVSGGDVNTALNLP